MTKFEVEKERLGECTIMPQECEMSFMARWKQLSSDSTVNVRYPHHCHGNSGKFHTLLRRRLSQISSLSLMLTHNLIIESVDSISRDE